MTTLSINLNLPLPSSKSKLEKNISSSNFNLAHIGRNSSVLPVAGSVAIRPNSNSRLNKFAWFGDPLAGSNSKSRLKLISPDSQSADLDPAPLANSKSRLPSCPPPITSFGAQSAFVLPIGNAQPTFVVPVVLPIADSFRPENETWPDSLFILHNKLMLQTQPFLRGPSDSLISTNHQKKYPNLYRHSFFFVGHGSYLLAGSCKNLILVSFYNGTNHKIGLPREALWNLATNDLKFLPRLKAPRRPFRHSHVTNTSIRNYGFGFDPVSQDYKVLRFVSFDFEDGSTSSDSEFMELYSLKTYSWKRVTYSIPGKTIHFAQKIVHINGILYWKAWIEEEWLSTVAIILAFDFATEKFSHFVPDHEEVVGKFLFKEHVLVEFDGLLAALSHSCLGLDSCTEPFTFEIWVWSGAESSWVRRVPPIDVPATDIEAVVGLFENDKLFLQTSKGELLLFDCATRELENLGAHAHPRRCATLPPRRVWFRDLNEKELSF